MAFTGKGKKLGRGQNDGDKGIISKLSQAVSESPLTEATVRVANVTKKLIKSSGKAAWYAGTTLLIVGVPLMIAMDREWQMNDQDLQQQTLLLGSPTVY
ncbi:Mitochondrial outer membrane translocase complex, subunit Tom22 [Corchorus olitorius]|uniref:Mitochondrial outer membrane translocase complex, subunit Tom22 n=1 Tax=Corchorus olitorius TaxID=93759 RepID=A0A1R3JKK6_9ROSI|nr:Mitochondrial outer membrane translocase complex, subunit Tom22 [Corchorus olitorius]